MKDKHLVFLDEATTVTDDELPKLADIIDRQRAKSDVFPLCYGQPATGHTRSGRIDLSYYERKAHINRGEAFDKVFAKAMGEAVHSGVGVIAIDSLNQLEERVTAMQMRRQRGSSKSILDSIMWKSWDAMMQRTVQYDLTALHDAQTRTTQGSSDPLFAAMELHNERVRLGKKAIKEMFHATPLNLNQQTKGPIKAKDWE